MTIFYFGQNSQLEITAAAAAVHHQCCLNQSVNGMHVFI
jgi:hypothetical protein